MAGNEAVASVGARDFEFTDRDFTIVCKLIRERAGIALSDSKRDMVYSRISRRLRALGLASFRSYLDFLQKHDDKEWEQFTNALTTNLTSFFREAHHFDALAEQLKLLSEKQDDPIDIWCCAASTGEEPYSILITACEVFRTLRPPVRLWATDIDTNVLQTASNGIYSIDRIDDLSDARKKRFFMRGTGSNSGMCRVHPALQELVTFEKLNLLDKRYPASPMFPIVFCRNVMIYFEKPLQREILIKVTEKMSDDARIYTGHSENYLHVADLITSCGRTIYRLADQYKNGRS